MKNIKYLALSGLLSVNPVLGSGDGQSTIPTSVRSIDKCEHRETLSCLSNIIENLKRSENIHVREETIKPTIEAPYPNLQKESQNITEAKTTKDLHETMEHIRSIIHYQATSFILDKTKALPVCVQRYSDCCREEYDQANQLRERNNTTRKQAISAMEKIRKHISDKGTKEEIEEYIRALEKLRKITSTSVDENASFDRQQTREPWEESRDVAIMNLGRNIDHPWDNLKNDLQDRNLDEIKSQAQNILSEQGAMLLQLKQEAEAAQALAKDDLEKARKQQSEAYTINQDAVRIEHSTRQSIDKFLQELKK